MRMRNTGRPVLPIIVDPIATHFPAVQYDRLRGTRQGSGAAVDPQGPVVRGSDCCCSFKVISILQSAATFTRHGQVFIQAKDSNAQNGALGEFCGYT